MWKNIDIKTSKRVVRYACIVFSVGCVIIGYGMRVFNVLCIAMVTFLFHNILYAFENIKTRIWFLIMHITIFTFLISRPFISMLRGEAWWERTSQKPENIVFSITAIMISMFMMYIGAVIAEHVLSTKKTIEKEGKKQFRDNLQAVSMVVFYITMVFFLIQEGEKLLFMHGKTYVEFYSGFQSKLPGGFLSIASLMRYSLCIFLATFPNKRRTFIALALYEISAIPQLLIGVRNPIILNSLFIFLYYFLRDSIGDEKKWIGKIEKLLLMI